MSLKELKSWWEVPAIAHFFSLFKSCFSLTDFTIEELEEALLKDGVDERATSFISRILAELLQGCYDNPNISFMNYHETLVDIMKQRWELQDGRINPLTIKNADFHNLPCLLKVQIVQRLTEYRLDALDVSSKLTGLNPSDLRLDPLGLDRHNSKYWYFFGVRLYKETPIKQKNQQSSNRSKPAKNSLKNQILFGEDSLEINYVYHKLYSSPFVVSKKKKKKHRKHHQENHNKNNSIFQVERHKSRWEVVCYTVDDWKKLAGKLKGTSSRREVSLRNLITENFLPNLPKIVKDMRQQKLQKTQNEQPRRSSCRLLARKLCREEDFVEVLKQEQNEVKRAEEEDQRLSEGFEILIRHEINRQRKEREMQREKERLRILTKRLEDGLDVEEDTTSGSDCFIFDEQEVVKSSDVAPPKAPLKAPPKAPLKDQIPKSSKKSSDSKKASKKSSADDVTVKDDCSLMWKAWNKLNDHPDSWPFRTPVEEWDAPGYYDVIKQPMDLIKIEAKLKSGKYKSIKDLRVDFDLMFSNCRLFNGPTSEYSTLADQMSAIFEDEISAKMTSSVVKDISKNEMKEDEVPLDVMTQQLIDDVISEEEVTSSPASSSSSSDEFTPSNVRNRKRRSGAGRDLRSAKSAKVTSSKRKSSWNDGDDALFNTDDDYDHMTSSSRLRRKRTSTRSSMASRSQSAKTRAEVTSSALDVEDSSDTEVISSNPSPPPITSRVTRKARNKPMKRRTRASVTSSRQLEVKSPVVKRTPSDENCVLEEDRPEVDEKEDPPLPEQPEVDIKEPEEEIFARKRVSSSSSVTSSRSQSREKFEKLEEDAKSKPQLLWSLDYLQSQYRVLEEERRMVSHVVNEKNEECEKLPLEVVDKEVEEKKSSQIDLEKKEPHKSQSVDKLNPPIKDQKNEVSVVADVEKKSAENTKDNSLQKPPLDGVSTNKQLTVGYKAQPMTSQAVTKPVEDATRLHAYNNHQSQATITSNLPLSKIGTISHGGQPTVQNFPPNKQSSPMQQQMMKQTSPHHLQNVHQLNIHQRPHQIQFPSPNQLQTNIHHQIYQQQMNNEKKNDNNTQQQSPNQSQKSPYDNQHLQQQMQISVDSVSQQNVKHHKYPPTNQTHRQQQSQNKQQYQDIHRKQHLQATLQEIHCQQQQLKPKLVTNQETTTRNQQLQNKTQQQQINEINRTQQQQQQTERQQMQQQLQINQQVHNKQQTINRNTQLQTKQPQQLQSNDIHHQHQLQKQQEQRQQKHNQQERQRLQQQQQQTSIRVASYPATNSNYANCRTEQVTNKQNYRRNSDHQNIQSSVGSDNNTMFNFAQQSILMMQAAHHGDLRQNDSCKNVSNKNMNQVMKQQQQISNQKISSHALQQQQQTEIQQTTNTNVINHRQKHQTTGFQQQQLLHLHHLHLVPATKQRHHSDIQQTNSSKQQQQRQSNNNTRSQSNNRRQSTTNNPYSKATHTDYMGYHIPQTPVNTTLSHSSNVSHQQNGFLTNNNAALLHQDHLTASATLRALQHQHANERPLGHQMLQYAAAAAAQSQEAEQYNRLTAAHRANPPQGTHSLAGVYHPHQPSSASSSAHLGNPWLQAAQGSGYPSNLLASAHIDPVYHLMHSTSMHGQYPMYPNPVMQQLHQQHLQHHMLPKY